MFTFVVMTLQGYKIRTNSTEVYISWNFLFEKIKTGSTRISTQGTRLFTNDFAAIHI